VEERAEGCAVQELAVAVAVVAVAAAAAAAEALAVAVVEGPFDLKVHR